MRGISNIVAAILLIGVALVLGSVLYSVVTSKTTAPSGSIEITYCKMTYAGNNTYIVVVGLTGIYSRTEITAAVPMRRGTALPIIDSNVPKYVDPGKKVEATLVVSGKPDTIVVRYVGGEAQCTP